MKLSIVKFHGKPSGRSCPLACGQTEKLADMTKLRVMRTCLKRGKKIWSERKGELGKK